MNELVILSNPAAKVFKKPFSAGTAVGKVRVSSCCGVEKADVAADPLLDDVTLVSDCTSFAGVITTLGVAAWSLDSVTLTRTAACCRRCCSGEPSLMRAGDGGVLCGRGGGCATSAGWCGGVRGNIRSS